MEEKVDISSVGVRKFTLKEKILLIGMRVYVILLSLLILRHIFVR
jgi:cell division protein FtsL